MKKTSLIMIMGVLLLSLAATAFVTAKVDAAPGAEPALQGTLIPSATPTALMPPVDNAATATLTGPIVNNSMIVLWDTICVKKVPYTILAIPNGATLELLAADGSIIPTLTTATPAPGENSCKSVLTIGDKQVIVCSGQPEQSFSIRVTNGSASEDFSVPMKACGSVNPSKATPGTPSPVPSVIPTFPTNIPITPIP